MGVREERGSTTASDEDAGGDGEGGESGSAGGRLGGRRGLGCRLRRRQVGDVVAAILVAALKCRQLSVCQRRPL